MNIDYTCKFCRRTGIAQLADDLPADWIQLDKWKAMLCCNRCADYMEAKRKCLWAIRKAAILLAQMRVTATGQELLKIEAAVRERLVGLTKRFAAVVCDYLLVETVWEEEFVNMLMDKPDRCEDIASHYVRGIRALKNKPS